MAITQTSGHETHTFSASTRERVGSRHARRARQSGGLPGVLYGHGQTPFPIVLDHHQASRFILAGEKVFNLELDGKGAETALLKDIQYDHLSQHIIHVDLERVNLDEVVETSLSIHLKGEPVGLKTAGAILQSSTLELEIECRVRDIIDYLDVSVDHLDIDDALHAGEIALPEGFKLLTDPDTVVASIQITKLVEEPTDEAGEATGEGGEPEVRSERKDDEDGKDKDD